MKYNVKISKVLILQVAKREWEVTQLKVILIIIIN